MWSKLLILLMSFGICVSPGAASQNDVSYPDIEFRYSGVFDRNCARQTGSIIKPEWVSELYQELPRLQAAWDKEGTILLREVLASVGKGFQRNEMIATLFLCRKTPSMSLPLLVKALWFLKGPSMGNPQPEHLFVGLTFHELLHTFIVENYSDQWPTPLIQKYKDESPGVLSHLHLMALQKYIYLKLNKQDVLNDVIKFEQQFGKTYIRTWEIINDIEGHQPFIEELIK